jgi:hypothetical protein
MRSPGREGASWKRVTVGLALASLPGATVLYVRMRSPPDERRVLSVVHELAAAAERRDVPAIAPLISLNYRDERGLTRPTALAALGEYLRTTDWSKILNLRVAVTRLEKDRAHATAQLILARAEGKRSGHRVAEGLHIELDLAREGGDWRVLAAEDWAVPSEGLISEK